MESSPTDGGSVGGGGGGSEDGAGEAIAPEHLAIIAAVVATTLGPRVGIASIRPAGGDPPSPSGWWARAWKHVRTERLKRVKGRGPRRGWSGSE